jgi:hypothetical protein
LTPTIQPNENLSGMRSTKPKARKLHKAAIAAPMLGQFEPMLPTLVHKAFSGQAWLFEPKWGWLASDLFSSGR